jgi:hypothetical protein
MCFGMLLAQLQAQNTLVTIDTFDLPAGWDSLSLAQRDLVPFSEEVFYKGKALEAGSYQLDWGKGVLRAKPALGGRWVVRYRYFGREISSRLRLRPLPGRQDSLSQDEGYQDVLIPPDEVPPDFFETSSLKRSGSLSRGITVGNRQGLAVTSGLRLQLEGDLGDGLRIVGAITDENLPIQPDGTTQQISDFDKIFIKLFKNDLSLTVGDYEINQKETHFANFYRNVQGLQFAYAGETTQAQVSGAVAKGKFNTNSFLGIEGVSGPYRLQGRNGEQFFIVLAGSEKVFLNGKLMKRGENYDYVINYNTAELFFTSKHLITSITRIVVDFEYTDFEFNRSLMFAQARHKMLDGRLNLAFSYGRDADNPNAPISNPEAYESARDSLARVGDQLSDALTSGASVQGFSETEVRYARKDSLVAGTSYEIFVWSRDPEEAIFQVSFSFVGTGNGDYRRDESGQNRTVFQWLAPDSLTGESRGDYAAVRRWVLPRLLQVVDVRTEYQLSKHLSLYNETALSVEDKNRLSNLDDDDNLGLALRSGVKLTQLKLADSLRLSAELIHQQVQDRYNNLDRIYQAEYNRIWDIEDPDARFNEQLVLGRTRWDYRKQLQLETEHGIRQTGPGRLANRQVYTLRSNLKKALQGFYTFTQIRSRDDSLGLITRWNRHDGDLFGIKGIWKPGVEIWAENRQRRMGDELGRGSFAFVDLKPYLRTINNKKLSLDLSFNYRLDREWLADSLRLKSRAWTAYSRLSWQPIPQLSLQQTTSLRDFRVGDSLFLSQGLVDTRLLNLNLQGSYRDKDRLVSTNFVYEVSSEQTARKEVRFIEVNPGQGQYVWLDSLFNKDGIQQIDEFQLAANPLGGQLHPGSGSHPGPLSYYPGERVGAPAP